jgi:hypothetical protein
MNGIVNISFLPDRAQALVLGQTTSGTCSSQLFNGSQAKEHGTQYGLGHLPNSPRQEPRPEPARASCSTFPPTVQRQNQTTTQPRPSAEVDDSVRARNPRWLRPASKFAQAVRRPPMPCMGRLRLLGNTARIFISFWCTHPTEQQSNGRKIAHHNL